ncbi:citrate lyase ligase [Tetragenococcus muriaticus PMC-11-5]|uniref:Citrate lyase ligase n=1 Tax=Tetragenococcus muriaticus PMC-11-5 TaxID=1302649 RepID=A0A091C7F7_9ENTE|nr:citrate lyase ligase [Tetragenococcus muriaticus PMC-11-5]
MDNMYKSKRIWLDKDKKGYEAWKKLMVSANLQIEEYLDYTLGIYDGKKLIATGSIAENIIKCVAVCKDYQSENLVNWIITQLVEQLNEEGYFHYFLYTNPERETIFRSLGFKKLL